MSNKVRNMSVKEIFSNPVLDYFIEPENCSMFLRKKTDYEAVANVVNSSKIDAILELMGTEEETSFGNSISISPEKFNNVNNADSVVTAKMAEKMKKNYIEFSDKISSEKLLLFLAGITQKFLEDIEKVKKGKFPYGETSEICYSNGDFITIKNNQIISSKSGNREIISEEDLQVAKEKMIEAILIANKQLNSSNRNSNFSILGNYKSTGNDAKIERMSYSAKELKEFAQNPKIFKELSAEKLIELVDKQLVSKHLLIKMLSNGVVDKNIAISLMIEGKLKKEEALKIFKVSRENDIPFAEGISYESKLLLYSAGKIKIDTLEQAVSQYQEENIDLNETFRKISKYYTNDIRKISEILTHNVLDYNNSQAFLDILKKEEKISSDDRTYLNKVMSDFKVNELLNNSKVEAITVNGEGNDQIKYKSGLTIDPEERKKYFQSLGAVKKLKIRGENFIKDNENNIGKKNSLDGYELFIIPEKRVAILEKLYETKRDSKGKIEYKTTKSGSLVPSVENATYVIPIEMALEFSKKKNKKELIDSPDVRRVSHSMEWVCNLESKVKSLMKSRGREIDFEKNNTTKWSDRIRQNYLANKKARENR